MNTIVSAHMFCTPIFPTDLEPTQANNFDSKDMVQLGGNELGAKNRSNSLHVCIYWREVTHHYYPNANPNHKKIINLRQKFLTLSLAYLRAKRAVTLGVTSTSAAREPAGKIVILHVSVYIFIFLAVVIGN